MADGQQAIIDVLNSLEVIDQEGGDHAYILVADNKENRQKLRSVGVTDEQITEAGDDGESFCLLALAFNNDLADAYEKGKFLNWGPIDDELRHRVLEGRGTAEDACRLLKALEPDLFGSQETE
ncbi:hypothetical protein QJ48_04230 [Paenibacillus sp. A3]|nr:hypothetical protein QJ48_04230 [Paenibacillus sp. A3]